VHEPLEDGRNKVVQARAIQIQKFWRGYVVRIGKSTFSISIC
jgi:hypothetical protein